MTPRIHTYETTYSHMSGDIVTGEIELQFEFTFSPGRPAYTPRGEYAPVDPPEAAEIEIQRVFEERWAKGKPYWSEFPAGEDHERYVEWAYEKHRDSMIKEAQGALADEEGAAMERGR